ncbi:MAG: SIR2 family NAD-dependent protein deacylase [Chitinophagales bacterium]
MKKLVILTGAGISAESGIQTFRGAGGLWNGHDIMEVATPQGWQKNPSLVNEFYNLRRKDAAEAKPNAAHTGLADLQEQYDVWVITQNVDDLHEKGGSKQVMHLHGKLSEVRSSKDPQLVYEIGGQAVQLGDKCEKGSQLRPNVVWFGEDVPMLPHAAHLCSEADIFVVIGTSMAVYPAASLIDYVPAPVQKYIIDPNMPAIPNYISNVTKIAKKATEGVAELKRLLG